MFDIIAELIKNASTMAVRIVFMGTPEFAVATLESLLHNGYRVVAVCTQPDKAAGRGRPIVSSPVKRLALERQIPIIQLETFESSKVVEELASLRPELIIVTAFGCVLPPQVLSLPEFGCLNVHPSLLPRHRGPSPVATAILSGDEVTGVTIMLMDTGLDTGPIIAREEVGMTCSDTTESLSAKLADVGAKLLLRTLPGWIRGDLKPQAQDQCQATYSKLITGRDAEIDWGLSALELWRMVRAYTPWPGCYTWCQGKRLKIHGAVPLPDGDDREIGKVIALTEQPGIGVVTGKGILGLRQIQLEGKREMLATDFVLGQRDFIGCILGRK
jgi:methionyl-tRNA formyltransferase